MRVAPLTVILLAIASACGTGVGSPVPPQRQQTDYGAGLYRYECASCHSPGQLAPDLTGSYLASRSATAAALAQLIGREMPLDRPGVLEAGDARAVTAYLLARDGMLPTRTGELTAANAASVQISVDGTG